MVRPIRGVLLDLDGTVYLGEALIPGAGEAIRSVKGAGVRVAYLTNKPLQPRAAYAEKLTRLGPPHGAAGSGDVLVCPRPLAATGTRRGPPCS